MQVASLVGCLNSMMMLHLWRGDLVPEAEGPSLRTDRSID